MSSAASNNWGGVGVPGHTAARFDNVGNVFFQSTFLGDVIYASQPIISSLATDAGNTPTTVLRPGLLMAQRPNKEWTTYDPDNEDGSSNIARGVLARELDIRDFNTGSAADMFAAGAIVVGGKIVAGNLIGLDYQARKQLTWLGHVVFDDHWHKNFAPFSKDSDYTVVASDNGARFDTIGASGAVNFTLPTLAVGLEFEFFNAVDQNMTVTSAAGNDIVAFNDLAASSIAFSTSSEKIGAFVRVEARYVGASLKWVVHNLSMAHTITIA